MRRLSGLEYLFIDFGAAAKDPASLDTWTALNPEYRALADFETIITRR